MADTLETRTLTLDQERALRTLEPHLDRSVGETLHLELGLFGDELVGYFVRTGFQDVPAAERLRWLDKFFAQQFGEEAKQIGLVLTFTPEEFDGWLEDRMG